MSNTKKPRAARKGPKRTPKPVKVTVSEPFDTLGEFRAFYAGMFDQGAWAANLITEHSVAAFRRNDDGLAQGLRQLADQLRQGSKDRLLAIRAALEDPKNESHKTQNVNVKAILDLLEDTLFAADEEAKDD